MGVLTTFGPLPGLLGPTLAWIKCDRPFGHLLTYNAGVAEKVVQRGGEEASVLCLQQVLREPNKNYSNTWVYYEIP